MAARAIIARFDGDQGAFDIYSKWVEAEFTK